MTGEGSLKRATLDVRAGRVLLHLGPDPHQKRDTDRVAALTPKLPGVTVLVVAAPTGPSGGVPGLRNLEPVTDTRSLCLAADAL